MSHATPVKHGSHSQLPLFMGTWLPCTHGSSHASPIHPLVQLMQIGGSTPAKHVPTPLQSGVPGQSGMSQPSPTQPGLQRQACSSALQRPWPEQLSPTPGQPLTSHRSPHHASSHTHAPFSQVPWLLHSTSQFGPLKHTSGSHTQMPESIGNCVPLTQGMSQADPIQPSSQFVHSGGSCRPRQSPRPWQSGSPGQSGTWQPDPIQPASHEHSWVAMLQTPWPEQGESMPGQPRTSHSGPHQPSPGTPQSQYESPVSSSTAHSPLPVHSTSQLKPE